MLDYCRVTPQQYVTGTIYTPGWREIRWSKVPCLGKQHDRWGLHPIPPNPEFKVLIPQPLTPPPSRVVPNTPVKPNRNGLFHLISNQNFPEFWAEWKGPFDLPSWINSFKEGQCEQQSALGSGKRVNFFSYIFLLKLTQLEGWPSFPEQLFSINTGPIVNQKFVIYIPTWEDEHPHLFQVQFSPSPTHRNYA